MCCNSVQCTLRQLERWAVGPNIYLWTGQVSTGCSLVSLLYFLIIFQQYNWICHRTTACFLLRKVVYLMFQNIHLIGGEVFIDVWLSVWRCRVIRRSPFIMKKDSEWSSIIMWKRGKKLRCIFFEFDFVPLKMPSCPSWIKVVYFHTCSQIMNNYFYCLYMWQPDLVAVQNFVIIFILIYNELLD